MKGGVLLVDKASGPSSHRVVSLARKALGTRDVGHAGTLDPLATGVLVLGVDEGLKLLRYLVLDDKRYRTTIALGTETDSLDAQGAITRSQPVPAGLDRDAVAAVAARFVGRFEQRVPEISAVKQGGERLYARARRGESVEAPSRNVVVHALQVLACDGHCVELEVSCGKGFYVRALARDLAAALGTVGHVTALRRLQSGAFGLHEALSLQRIEQAAGGDAAARAELVAALLDAPRALPHAVRLSLTPLGLQLARHGRPVPLAQTEQGVAWQEGAPTEPVLLHDASGALVALAALEADVLRIVRGMRGELTKPSPA